MTYPHQSIHLQAVYLGRDAIKRKRFAQSKSQSLSNPHQAIALPATLVIKFLKKRIKNKWLLIGLPFLFFLIKGLIWLAIFYGLWDVIKGSVS